MVSQGLKTFQKFTYSVLFKRNSAYIIFVLTGAFFAEKGIDYVIDSLWEKNNQGVNYLFN
jgi:hypothetical protein